MSTFQYDRRGTMHGNITATWTKRGEDRRGRERREHWATYLSDMRLGGVTPGRRRADRRKAERRAKR